MGHETLKTGDRIYCESKKKYGFVTRTNPLGLIKSKAIAIVWMDNTRDTYIGEACVHLVKQ